ncbi:MAG: hypothetical protein F4X82_02675 [Candidatus Spechtbacteria bacterium SB0662_bin_43]|uniref:Uncharacterized protein n=1 Tax=Candidatus Spechtbacteria bacterium SB0662_bin_43 TaxID=2604897 RepID=A0A845DCK3_9BACT|nr:hypothetical protein [Candidatus Spechtbacteria bacterium SB0662_bin_43]
MNTLNYKYLFFLSFPFLSLFFFLILPVHSSPALSQEERTNKIIETQKQKIQECIALSEFQDSCYFELCENRNPYICTEDILDAIVVLADPQKAMDVLNGVMESSLFAIQTSGHLLSHVIGNSIAHYYGFTGESFLLCPEGFNWGCTHGFFEDALKIQSNPVQAAIDICESIPEHPAHRKFFCYHGVGHIFMFNESWSLMNALSLCDLLLSSFAQQGCYQGVLMENADYILIDTENGYVFKESKEEQGFFDSDLLAPCNRLEDKYRPECYTNHGYYLLHRNDFSMKDASHVCLGAVDYHIPSCITGLGIMLTNPYWQDIIVENNPIEPFRETTFIENFAYLCNQFPSEYIEECQTAGLANFLNYDYTEDSIEFCSLYGVNKTNCFGFIGTVLNNRSTSSAEVVEKCGLVPKEYQGSCIGAEIEFHETTQQYHKNADSVTQENSTVKKYAMKTEAETPLLYLFIVLGCILLGASLTYYFYRTKKHLWSKYIGR